MASSTLAGAGFSVRFVAKVQVMENSDDRTRFIQVLYNPVIKKDDSTTDFIELFYLKEQNNGM